MAQVIKSSFLDHYLNDSPLGPLSPEMVARLQQLEQELEQAVAGNGGDFGECVKTFGPQLVDLAQRLGEKVHNISVHSIRDALNLIQFATNVGFEVYQIVDGVKDCVFPSPLPASEARQKEIDFGKDLAYFVWMTVDPLAGVLTWLPFKKTIEEMLVKWIAGMVIGMAFDIAAKSGTLSKTARMGDKLYVKAL